MMLALMFDPKFKDLFIMNNYVGREETIIATSMYDFETLLPHLTYVY
jgi:hypothetical protein